MMRRKTTLEVAHHIYQEVASWIDARISGNVYPFDCRPMDSHDEDAIIIVSTATADQIQEEVGKEYRKEFLAEGQMFFYYKRLDASRIEGAGVNAQSIYVLPMPDTEIEFGERK